MGYHADAADLIRYRHTPGNPVVDRLSALISVRNHGKPGSAIAAFDTAVVAAAGEPVTVMAVDHRTGTVTVETADGGRLDLPGIDLIVTEPNRHPPVPDDYLEGKTLADARAQMAVIASDRNRYPQYSGGYFNGWVFGRARRDVKHRGEVILTAGQRCLVNVDRAPSSDDTYTAWITRRISRAVLVWRHDIDIEPVVWDPEVLARAEDAGRQAYADGRPSAPAADPTVMALVAGLPVGAGAIHLFLAFQRGRNAAADAAAQAALTSN